MIRIKSDKIIVDEQLIDGYLYIEGDKIVEVSSEVKPADVVYDYTGLYVSPGFIEMHTHGAVGETFIDCDVDGVIKACNFQLSKGVTTILPTLSAAPYKMMKEGVRKIALAKRDARTKCNVLGAHLEGPYFSTKQGGAQKVDFMTPPIEAEYSELLNEYPDDVARFSYAPENDEGGKFSKYITERGVLSSAGHTDATFADMKVAMANGCKLITHLYSCTSTITRDKGFRILGVIETAYLEDDMFVEIIADGKHLPPDLINMIIKIKGSDKVALITDSLAVAGTDLKEGTSLGIDFVVDQGVARLKDLSGFAGSIATADRCIRVVTNDCKRPLTEAVKMYTKTPATILGLNKGSLVSGFDADVIVFDDNIDVKHVFVMGDKKEI